MSSSNVAKNRGAFLKRTMQNVIYPAFAGSACVWLVQWVATGGLTRPELNGEPNRWILFGFGLFLAAYYAVSCSVVNETFPDEKFGYWAFLWDAAGSFVAVVSFHGLGFITSSVVEWKLVYIGIGLIPVTALLGKLLANRDQIRWLSSIMAGCACLLPWIFGADKTSPWHVVSLALVYVALARYAWEGGLIAKLKGAP